MGHLRPQPAIAGPQMHSCVHEFRLSVAIFTLRWPADPNFQSMSKWVNRLEDALFALCSGSRPDPRPHGFEVAADGLILRSQFCRTLERLERQIEPSA